MSDKKPSSKKSFPDSSVRSTLDVTMYVAPAQLSKCGTCDRGPKFFEGCSHPDCPQRRALSIRQWK